MQPHIEVLTVRPEGQPDVIRFIETDFDKPGLPIPRRPVIVAGDLRRYLERDPPGLVEHLAGVRLFNRSLEAIVTTCRAEHQPLRHRLIVRVLHDVIPGWEQPERQVRSLFNRL